jgi:hypothetical protein
VDCYLPYFRQQLITCPLLALLSFQSSFTESSCGNQLLAPPCFSGTLRAPRPPLLHVPFQFLVYYSGFFCKAVVILSWGLYWFISVVAVRILSATYLLICWSASPKLVSSWHLVEWKPSCFLNVLWHGEAFSGWEFRVSEF